MEIKDYNVIDGRNFFDKPIRNDLKSYDNIRKIATGQGDDYTTGCLRDYPYFIKYYKLIAIEKANNKLVLLGKKVQECIPLLKKRKKQF